MAVTNRETKIRKSMGTEGRTTNEQVQTSTFMKDTHTHIVQAWRAHEVHALQ